jgi:hypothetical protein
LGVSYRVVGGGERVGEQGVFEVAVVLLGGGDVAAAELPGDEEAAVAGSQPVGAGGVSRGVGAPSPRRAGS